MRVAFILKGYPRLSETFIAQEIAALERRGLDILIVSLRRPTDARRHRLHDTIRARVLYLPEYLLLEPLRVLRAWWKIRQIASYASARRLWLRDLARDPTPNRARRFGQALVLAAELPEDVKHLHAHFLHTPASVTRYAAALLGLPWTGSAHAKDIWTTPEWEKREKLGSCEWLVTCTRANREHLAALAPPGKVELLYHGIDLARFPRNAAIGSARDGSSEPVVILSVARLVEKKGTEILLEALARISPALQWRFVHVGGGPLLKSLQGRAARLGIQGRVTWRGALTQDEVLAEYRKADVFALASRIARDGDRDGLPNVIAEAQSQGLACVATRVSAIPELVRDGQTGLLVPPDDAEALARDGDRDGLPNVIAEAQSQGLACVATRVSAIPELVRDGQTGILVPENDAEALARALESLIADPARRRALGQAAQTRVREGFALEPNIDALARRFGVGSRAHRVLRTA